MNKQSSVPHVIKIAFTFGLLLVGVNSFAQMGISNVAITPDPSSVLELRSNTAGFLPPRMTTTERDAIVAPATGLLIYNTTTSQLNYYTGSAWQPVVVGSAITSLNGLTAATQTFVNGTNVTMTSSGSTHTLGWTGLLPVNKGGTGLGTFGGTNRLLYTTTTDNLSSITTANNGVLITSAAGVPSIGTTLPSAVQTNITSLGTIGTGSWNATAIADGKIASALTGKTYNGLTLTSLGTGFSIAGGTVSKTLTLSGDATISGTNTGDQTTITGNAGSATLVNVSDDIATGGVMYPTWVAGTSGNQAAKTSSTKLTFNPSTGVLNATGFSGNLTGNVTGNLTGNASTVTTNANLTGDVTSIGNVSTIANNAVGNIKLAQMAATTIKGNNTGATANATDLTPAQVAAILPTVTSTLNGLAPASGGGTTNYLRADGTWTTPPNSGGTVTSVSVTSANGVSGTVANSTSTPAISLTLGAITPTSVAATGTVTGSNLSGTNTGDQTTITGNAGSATLTAITDDIATNATMFPTWVTTTSGNQAQKTTSTKLTFNPATGILSSTGFSGNLTGNVTGNVTGSATGNAGSATLTAVTDDIATAATVYPTWVTATSGNQAQKISSSKFSFNPSTGIVSATGFVGNLTGNITGNASTVTTNANLTGDVTSVGNATTISTGVVGTNQLADNNVTNGKLAQMATNTIKGNNTGATANASDLTTAQVAAMLPSFSTSAKGVVPVSPGGTDKYLRADGTWDYPTPGISAMTATTAAITTTETNIMSATIPANTFAAGKTYRITVFGTGTSTVANTSNLRVRIGTTNTTTDAAIATITQTASTTGTAVPFYADLVVTIRTAGSTGTATGSGMFTNTIYNSGISANGVAVATPTTATVNTTVANYLHVSFNTSATTTSGTFYIGFIETVN